METYYIYHIPGVKVGCTNNIDRRNYENKKKLGKNVPIEIIKITYDLNEADQLESEYSIKLGYGPIPEPNRYINSYKRHQYRTVETFKKISDKMKGKRTGIPLSLETREKMSKARKGKKIGRTKGKGGKLYIELTSGYIGKRIDMIERYPGITLSYYVKRNAPIVIGPYKGLHFAIYTKDI